MSHPFTSVLVPTPPIISPSFASTSHAMSSWPEPVAWFTRMLQFNSMFGEDKVRSMIEWLCVPCPELVASSLFHTRSYSSSIRFSQNSAFLRYSTFGFHILLCAFMSPAMMTYFCLEIPPQSAFCTGRSVSIMVWQSYTLVTMITSPFRSQLPPPGVIAALLCQVSQFCHPAPR